ncbi:hypothetical protein ACJX0J_024948, partial [Zea mays]
CDLCMRIDKGAFVQTGDDDGFFFSVTYNMGNLIAIIICLHLTLILRCIQTF